MICDISYKTLIDSKPLRIRPDKIDGFIRIYDRTRYLTLFSSENYGAIYNRIRYLISLKSGMTFFLTISRKSKLILRILCLKKKKHLHNVIIHIKSVLNKGKNDYYYQVFLGKCSYQLVKK